MPAIVVAVAMAAVLVGLFALQRRAPAPTDGAAGPGASSDGGRVLISSPHNEGIQIEFQRAFEAWHLRKFGEPCVVEWRDHGGTSDAVRFIKSEFTQSPQGIGLDIFWGGGIEPYIQFAEIGCLESVDLPEEIMAMLPADVGGVPLFDEAHTWYGTALSGFGILYNRRQVAALELPEPKTWADIASPAYFGQVAAADPRSSGTAQTMVEVILQAYGWEEGYGQLARIAANVRTFTRSAGDVPKMVSLGDAAAGLAIDFYAWTQIQLDGKEKIGFVLPEGLTPITPDGIGILKGAPNLVRARRFVEFVMSPEGQRLWVLPKGYPSGPVEYELLRIPVLPEVYREYADVTNVLFDPSTAKSGFDYDAEKSAARREVVKDLYGALFIDLAPELSKAWKGVIGRGLKPDEVRALCRPPISEAEAMELARTTWSDPAVRNSRLTEWTNAARQSYKKLEP
jgi:ABC-type Fe3+ transport system substrate-binding protein